MVKSLSVSFLRGFLLFLLASTLLFSSLNKLRDVKVSKGELRLKFTNTISKNEVKHFTLSNPCREVFDFKNTIVSNKNFAKYLKNIKIAQYKPTVVRVVINSSKSYYCSAYKPILSKNKYHIPLPPKKYKALPAKRYKKRTTKVVKKYSHKNEVIVIDAGHGGHDSGAVGGGKREKDIVLSIARKLEKRLKKSGYSVYMTRRTDRFLKLHQRTKIADKKNATLFISIHANAVGKKSRRNKIHGVETFFLQKTRDAKSQRIAARENRSVLKGTSRLSKNVILDSVLSGPKIVQSNKLAIDVQGGIIKNLRRRYRGVRDGGVRHAPFWVLVGASRPSILVEVGYISHPKERKRLSTPLYQELIAKGIADGVDSYLSNRKNEIDF